MDFKISIFSWSCFKVLPACSSFSLLCSARKLEHLPGKKQEKKKRQRKLRIMLENVVCQKHENGRTERTSTHIQERNCWRLGRKI